MEGIFEKYLTDVRLAMPLHRLILAGWAFICLIHDSGASGMSPMGSAWNMRLVDFGFAKGQALGVALVADLAIAASVVLGSIVLHVVLSRAIFRWASGAINLTDKVSEFMAARAGITSAGQEGSSVAMRLTEELGAEKAFLSRLSAAAEFLLGQTALVIVLIFSSTSTEIVVGTIGLFLGAALVVASVLSYLRYVLPLEIQLSVVQGRAYRPTF